MAKRKVPAREIMGRAAERFRVAAEALSAVVELDDFRRADTWAVWLLSRRLDALRARFDRVWRVHYGADDSPFYQAPDPDSGADDELPW